MDRYKKENMSNFATATNKRLKTEEKISCGPACCTRSKTRMSVATTGKENVAGPSRTSCYESSLRAKYQSGLQNPGLKRLREPLANLGERRARITTALSEVGEGSTGAIKKESAAFHEQKKLYSIVKQKKETKEHEYVKFSNENITDSNKYRRIVRYSGAAQNSSVMIYNNSSPFKELACKAQQIIIIHDGLPSLMKKTLKRQIIRSSGIRGIIDLDPNKNTVHPSILYSSYLTDIIKILLVKETKYALLAGFMKKSSLHPHTRKTLVNWLLKVQQYFKSDSSVFFTTVRLFDRLLNMTSIPLDHVQLVGVVAYWIASKFNDIIITLKVNEIEKICRYKFTTSQLMSTEHKVLRFLKFDINLEEPMIFVRYYIYKMQLPDCDELSFCSNYILDCLALDSDFSSITLSFQAASAVHLSLIYLDYDTRIWSRLVDQPGFYTPLKMLPLQTRMQSLIQLVQDPNFEFREAFVKYKSERYGAISFKLLKKQIGT